MTVALRNKSSPRQQASWWISFHMAPGNRISMPDAAAKPLILRDSLPANGGFPSRKCKRPGGAPAFAYFGAAPASHLLLRIDDQRATPIKAAPPSPVMTSGICTSVWQYMITDRIRMA